MAPDFLTSLAIAGIDGTIRNRFLGTEEVGLVRAKTGTLSSVSALSGYVGDKDDVLVFTIFVEGFRHRRLNEIRHAQVATEVPHLVLAPASADLVGAELELVAEENRETRLRRSLVSVAG